MTLRPFVSPSTDWERLSFPRLCGLLAEKPTKLSQAMHNAAFRDFGLPFTYVAFDTTDTVAALAAMRLLGIRGMSLTIPHKERALPLVDRLSDEAKTIGAINTVINTGDELYGENTDWRGIVRALSEGDRSFVGGSAVVVGAGGAAAAALFALKSLGFTSIAVSNRTHARAEELAQQHGVTTLPYSEIGSLSPDSLSLFVNATPIGSHLASGDFGFDLSARYLPLARIVFDMVTRETPLLLHSKAVGAETVSGLRMLLHQAADQFQLFTELAAPVDTMERALYGQAGVKLDLPPRPDEFPKLPASKGTPQ